MDDFKNEMTTAEGDLVGAVYLLRRDGAALLQLRDNKPELRHPNMWVPPGGHCDPGETPLACARREFLEETCYQCHDLHLLTVVTVHPGARWRPAHVHMFWSAYDGVQPVAAREGQALEFIPRDRAASLSMPTYVLPIWDQALALFSHTPISERGIA